MGIIHSNFRVVNIPEERNKGGLDEEGQVLIVPMTCNFFSKGITKFNVEIRTFLKILIGTGYI